MKPRGFTIFFAVLVASLSLAIGLAIYDLLIRELELSQTATQSQYAIYAADTGAECALYWDLNYDDGSGVTTAFATSTASNEPSSGISCAGQDVAATAAAAGTWPIGAETDSDSAITQFEVLLTAGNDDGPCAIVRVEKVILAAGEPPTTKVTSSGRNTCVSGAALQLERTLEVNY